MQIEIDPFFCKITGISWEITPFSTKSRGFHGKILIFLRNHGPARGPNKYPFPRDFDNADEAHSCMGVRGPGVGVEISKRSCPKSLPFVVCYRRRHMGADGRFHG